MKDGLKCCGCLMFLKELEKTLVIGCMYIHSSRFTLILANNAQQLENVTNSYRLVYCVTMIFGLKTSTRFLVVSMPTMA